MSDKRSANLWVNVSFSKLYDWFNSSEVVVQLIKGSPRLRKQTVASSLLRFRNKSDQAVIIYVRPFRLTKWQMTRIRTHWAVRASNLSLERKHRMRFLR